MQRQNILWICIHGPTVIVHWNYSWIVTNTCTGASAILQDITDFSPLTKVNIIVVIFIICDGCAPYSILSPGGSLL